MLNALLTHSTVFVNPEYFIEQLRSFFGEEQSEQR